VAPVEAISRRSPLVRHDEGIQVMKHAGRQALSILEPVLRALRKSGALVERSPGSFYLRSKAFLHFHEHQADLYADVKENLRVFTRYRVTTHSEQSELLTRVNLCLSKATAASNPSSRRRARARC
jgi:hypothetical protein